MTERPQVTPPSILTVDRLRIGVVVSAGLMLIAAMALVWNQDDQHPVASTATPPRASSTVLPTKTVEMRAINDHPTHLKSGILVETPVPGTIFTRPK